MFPPTFQLTMAPPQDSIVVDDLPVPARSSFSDFLTVRNTRRPVGDQQERMTKEKEMELNTREGCTCLSSDQHEGKSNPEEKQMNDKLKENDDSNGERE